MISETQAALLELACELDEICRKNDIKYYLGGGTALGAIRSGGILPWDNDMDLYMGRDEYNKLCAVIDKEIKPNRFFANTERSSYYLNPIARYGNSDTTKLYFSQMTDGTACGQHLDILIFDYLPKDEDEQEKFKGLMQIYCEILQPYFVVNRKMYKSNNFFDYPLYKKYLERVQIEGKKSVIKELEDYLFSFPESETDMYCMRWGIQILCYNKEYFGEPRRIPFEGTTLQVAQQAENIFSLAYGDNWMLMPPKKERKPKRSVDRCDIPFRKVLDAYHNDYDKDLAVSDFEGYTRAALYFKILRENYGKKRHLEVFKNKTKALSEKNRMTVKRFLSLQLDRDTLDFEIAVPAQDQIVEDALLVLLRRSQFARVTKICALREKEGLFLTEKMQKFLTTAKEMRTLSTCFYNTSDFEHISAFAHTYDGDDFPLFDAMKNIAMLNGDMDMSEDVVTCLREKLTKEDYRSSDLFVKTSADIFKGFDHLDEAKKWHSAILAGSDNAILVRDVKDQNAYDEDEAQRMYIDSIDFAKRYEDSRSGILGAGPARKVGVAESEGSSIVRQIRMAFYLLFQPLTSDFSIFRTMKMRSERIIYTKKIDRYRRNYETIKEMTTNI